MYNDFLKIQVKPNLKFKRYIISFNGVTFYLIPFFECNVLSGTIL